MNYRRTYFALIRKALKRNKCAKSVYCEDHHIIPKSFVKNNWTVTLTLREHFICHKLIYKYCLKRYGPSGSKTNKALLAFFFMSNRMDIKRSKEYEQARSAFVDYLRSIQRPEYVFYHKKYGKFVGTMREFIEKYPNLKTNNLSSVWNGYKHHYRGWCISEEMMDKVEKGLHTKKKVYKFVHNQHGIFEGSLFQMKDKFSHMKLNISTLAAVYRNERSQHKGWRRLDYVDTRNKIKWIHSEYGIVEAGVTELVNLFPELKLNRGHLSSVKTGRLKHHKKWKLLNE